MRRLATFAGAFPLDSAIAVAVDDRQDRPDGTATITFTLRTSPAVTAIYALKGQLRVVIESGSLLPREFEEQIVRGLGITGGRPKHTKLVYNQARRTLQYYKERNAVLTLRPSGLLGERVADRA